MSDPLNKKVEVWLQKQGYPLEMESAFIAKSCGFEVSQSDYYFDPDENQPREIDLVLSAQKFVGKFNLDYKLFVECKSTREKPWLLFATENDLIEREGEEKSIKSLGTYGAFLSNQLGRNLLLQSFYNGNRDHLFPRLDTRPALGYGVTQAFSEGNETPFKALMSATKAALWYAKKFGGVGMLSTPFVFATPVVVIDAPLFNVFFSEKTSEIELEEVSSGWLYWKHVVDGRSRIGVYIVQKAELKSFLSECYASATWWVNQNVETLQSIFDEEYPPK